MSAFEVDPREERLPRWARVLLDEARRKVTEAERDAARARHENPPDEKQWAWLDTYGKEPYPLPVPHYMSITLTAPGSGPEFREQRLSIKMLEDGSLEVHGHHGPLAVRGHASNVFRITSERH